MLKELQKYEVNLHKKSNHSQKRMIMLNCTVKPGDIALATFVVGTASKDSMPVVNKSTKFRVTLFRKKKMQGKNRLI